MKKKSAIADDLYLNFQQKVENIRAKQPKREISFSPVYYYIISPHVRKSKTFLDSGFHAVDSGFQVLDSSLCHWNLDSGFQPLVGFPIPYAEFRIPQAKISRIPLHGAIYK